MLISFIIASQGKEERIFKTINSLKKQTNNDFEILLINDDPNIEKESLYFIREQFEQNENVTLVLNNKSQGSSSDWNTALQLAKGEYFAIIKEGDVLEPIFVETIHNVVAKESKKLDIIQFKQELLGIAQGYNNNDLLESDRVYDLTNEKEVYAYINQELYGKVFRLQFLKDFRLNFRSWNRFDTLFIYQALGHARTFYQISEKLNTHRRNVLKYSAFDLVNQWPHILNYYRRIGAYKELKDELNYANIYGLTFHFLKMVAKFDNKQLYKKALKYVKTKMEGKLIPFTTENKIFLDQKNEEFTNYILEFNTFINNEIKKNK
ncbi:glycosyltransferase family 2 protein [Williamsoniiplasma lucivorax]|uniref:Glycosyltransferase n=1 Tax=Williamsoniiplasma lucivorax TaxID=209274 RepID=A0A2S5RA39_9MOLU|nr:glycosyltransferase family 2 protein [Williamsoniiplasma lucivorax]PPE04167.1 glycosyltransferase [Williamsoniiplasma lucivorax]